MSPLLLAFFLLAAQDPAATVLPDVVVEGQKLDPLITVVVTGDIPAEALVRSDPIGVRCGVAALQYDAYASPRLCWIRRPEAEVVHLTAEGLDRLGQGWTVEWTGCDPQPDGRRCDIAVPRAGASVTARFRHS